MIYKSATDINSSLVSTLFLVNQASKTLKHLSQIWLSTLEYSTMLSALVSVLNSAPTRRGLPAILTINPRMFCLRNIVSETKPMLLQRRS